MNEYIVKILETGMLTHDVRMFRTEKPENFSFIPGQATDITINKEELIKKKRPFSFTCLVSKPYLEFIIKIYPARRGVTLALGELKPGDELIVREAWGAISYKGKGLFIAGGAGITPFISIFRDLHSRNELNGNILIFGNRTRADIILREELTEMLGDNFVNILSDEVADGYQHGFLDSGILRQHINNTGQHFYVCGPPPMMDLVQKELNAIGVGKNLITVEF